MKFIAEIGVTCSSQWFHSLSFNAHFFHIFVNCVFRNTFTSFLELPGDFRSTIVLLGLIVDLKNFILDRVLSLLGSNRLVTKEGKKTGPGYA